MKIMFLWRLSSILNVNSMGIYRWVCFGFVFCLVCFAPKVVDAQSSGQCEDITQYSDAGAALIDENFSTSLDSLDQIVIRLDSVYHVCYFSFARSSSDSLNFWRWSGGEQSANWNITELHSVPVNTPIGEVIYGYPEPNNKSLSEFRIFGDQRFILPVHDVSGSGVFGWLPVGAGWVIAPLAISLISLIMGSFSSKNTFAWQVAILLFFVNYSFRGTDISISDQFIFTFSLCMIYWSALWAGGALRAIR
jgi:hypothetical protein